MAQQTAVEWLIDTIGYKNESNRIIISIHPDCDITDLILRAKQMEKEQIMKAVDRGFDEGCKFPEDMTLRNSEQYYNETYNK